MEIGGNSAPDSPAIKRAKEKLEKQWKNEAKQVTPDALKDASEKIERWMGRHASDREPLKNEDIKYTPKASKSTDKLRVQAKRYLEGENIEESVPKKLRGHISSSDG